MEGQLNDGNNGDEGGYSHPPEDDQQRGTTAGGDSCSGLREADEVLLVLTATGSTGK